jgi:hypothetical protein
MLRVVGKHVPPPPGIEPPPLWGTEERLRELLGKGISSLQTTRRSYVFRYPSAGYFVEYFRTYYGPTLRVFGALDETGRNGLARDLQGLLESWNESGDTTSVVPPEYLETVAVRR